MSKIVQDLLATTHNNNQKVLLLIMSRTSTLLLFSLNDYTKKVLDMKNAALNIFFEIKYAKHIIQEFR